MRVQARITSSVKGLADRLAVPPLERSENEDGALRSTPHPRRKTFSHTQRRHAASCEQQFSTAATTKVMTEICHQHEGPSSWHITDLRLLTTNQVQRSFYFQHCLLLLLWNLNKQPYVTFWRLGNLESDSPHHWRTMWSHGGGGGLPSLQSRQVAAGQDWFKHYSIF